MNPALKKSKSMRPTVRVLLQLQAAAFIAAALMHFGVLVGDYAHLKAGIAESVIGTVLLAGLVCAKLWPASAHATAIAAQSFALLGTAVGLFTIVIGVGPRTVLDLVFHVGIVIALVSGLVATIKAAREYVSTDRRA
jgi:hypothetical protein